VSLREIVDAHPRPPVVDRELLVRCAEECFECTATCTSCVDACLAEDDLQALVRCIRLCLDCADECAATGRVVLRQTETDRRVLGSAVDACAAACRASAQECARHAAHHEHCRTCAEVCRGCAEVCDELLASLG
jgi:hypothetical protein